MKTRDEEQVTAQNTHCHVCLGNNLRNIQLHILDTFIHRKV